MTFGNIDANEVKLEADNVEKFSMIRATIKLTNSAIGITADFNVNFTVEMKCGRCLTNFIREFPASLYLTYIQGKDPKADTEKVDLKTSEVERMYFTGPNLDLSIGIKEAIVLSIPIASLCDSGCKGLCPVCGTNRNIKKCKCKVKKDRLFIPIQTKQKTKRKRRKK